ncbi:DUF983 domain-containing protein [Chitinophaga agri]|uniref:DUF983 domain-containing protein n=1 Tax=Chitinophaga agri TaxID=2703787 RepID=A0A6B9ZL34_9BACT|nr:DUF983 domain-containing protein [Chitinophaga agri]QHS63140.1 DUF983 domain-containing protein [Chitinophaga agri]
MCAVKTEKKPNLLGSILTNSCPACRRGKIFKSNNAYNLKHFTEMNDHCPVCGEDFEREIGFYYGTGYVSYALTVAFSVATFIAWWVIIGFSLYDNRMFWWLGINGVLLVLLQPPIMRVSRTIWLAFFVRYRPNYKEPRPSGV